MACTSDPTVTPQPETIPGSLAGLARVIDGDTLDVAGVRVRLHGIDAPELSQTCQHANGATWACGQWSRDELAALVGKTEVTCRQRDVDRYGRVVAVCAAGGHDVNAAMVNAGAAKAYRKYAMDYAAIENQATRAGRGIWQGQYVDPADYRRQATSSPAQQASSSCLIKGNISEAGRIYHIPGQRDYAATQSSANKGESWFCSEAEARAAGWRRARR